MEIPDHYDNSVAPPQQRKCGKEHPGRMSRDPQSLPENWRFTEAAVFIDSVLQLVLTLMLRRTKHQDREEIDWKLLTGMLCVPAWMPVRFSRIKRTVP